MTLYTESFFVSQSGGVTASAATAKLGRSIKAATGPFDVFLSHSMLDSRVILGVREWLISKELSVYVDWIDDPELDRALVSPATAARLRTQMQSSRALIYATSRAARASRWMPWELGYFDGIKGSGQISILPIESASRGNFVGEEYVGLYKQIERIQRSDGSSRPSVTDLNGQATSLKSFVHSQHPGRR